MFFSGVIEVKDFIKIGSLSKNVKTIAKNMAENMDLHWLLWKPLPRRTILCVFFNRLILTARQCLQNTLKNMTA